jgi:Ca-activated chloride channel family protein
MIFQTKVQTPGKLLATLALLGSIILAANVLLPGQERRDDPLFRVNVDLVVLTFTVTDNKGKVVTGLKPEDLRITEDGTPQKIVTFAEGAKTQLRFSGSPAVSLAGVNVFILFDTSNGMYKGFAYASDAIAEFVRRLDQGDSVAVYTFSRNLSRMATLTKDHHQAIVGLRNAVAGDDTALYNTLLLTLRDAARQAGRKAVVVFSNGPDNARVIAPDDVRAVAEDEGIPIYVISTEEGRQDSISAHVFQRLTVGTGGRLYWARDWQKQAQAFASVRDDISSSYAAAYYPAPNVNEGFRKIKIEILSDVGNKYRVRARPGYRSRGPL